VGEATYLASLVDGVLGSPTSSPGAGYIKEKAVLRHLIHAAARIAQSCYEAEEDAYDHCWDRAENPSSTSPNAASVRDSSGIGEVVKEASGPLDSLAQSKELVTGIPTGFMDWDERTSGLPERATW